MGVPDTMGIIFGGMDACARAAMNEGGGARGLAGESWLSEVWMGERWRPWRYRWLSRMHVNKVLCIF
jgi:hypothetical protein